MTLCGSFIVQRHRHPNDGASRQVLRVNLARLFACARIDLHYAKGWGDTEEDVIASDFLRHVTKRILNQSKCRQIYKFNEYQDHMLCAYEPGKGTCQVFSTE
jgi:hypothetical protein